MKIRLVLSRAEVQGLMGVLRAGATVVVAEGFMGIQMRDALYGLTVRMAGRLPTLRREKNRLTLGEGESMALWAVCRLMRGRAAALEAAAIERVMTEMDFQTFAHETLLTANQGF